MNDNILHVFLLLQMKHQYYLNQLQNYCSLSCIDHLLSKIPLNLIHFFAYYLIFSTFNYFLIVSLTFDFDYHFCFVH